MTSSASDKSVGDEPFISELPRCAWPGRPCTANALSSGMCGQHTDRDQVNKTALLKVLRGAKALNEFTVEGFRAESEVARSVLNLAVNFNPSKHNVYLYGPCGTGKTHLLSIMVRTCWYRDQYGRVMNPSDISGQVLEHKERSGRLEEIRYLANYRVLAIDEVGIRKESEAAETSLYEVIDARYLRGGGGLWISSNLSLGDLAAHYGDERIASRLAEMCKGNIFDFSGEKNRRLA